MTRLREAGFTLLETMIAMAIMVIAFTAILMAESSSLNSSMKAKQMNTVSMLAKNIMVESEYKIEGKKFAEISKEESGKFPDPYQDYSWRRTIKEIKFPTISFAQQGSENGDTKDNSASERLSRLFSKFLSKSLREMTVTVSWKKGEGEQSFSTSTYWVDLNNAFDLQE